jgi:Cu/Ag efflux pump CusA
VQKLAEICIRRPIFATMIILALVVTGAAAYLGLGVDRFPAVDIPQVRVRATLSGSAPEEMETEVAQPLEEAVNTVEGLDEMRSVSGPGSTFVLGNFKLDRNGDAAAQDVRDRVSTVMNELPVEMDPPTITKFDNESTPVMTIALSADRSLRELTDLADRVVKVQLERARGVGEVSITGGLERAINIWVDADRLAARGLPITAVRDAILRQNAQVPGGNVTTDVGEQSLRTIGRLTDPAAFDDLVIATREGTPIRVRDVGWAEDGTKEQRSVTRLDDVPTVTLEVMRQSGANTVAVIEAAKANMARVAEQLPPDVHLDVIRDQSRYIYAALHEITVHLVLGSVLACLVVLLFMRSWRSTIIAGVAIPASVIATFACMWPLGFTLNSVTMLALVLMVGIVIDDAIVVLGEHLPLRRGEADAAHGGGAGGDGRDRARRPRDDAQPRRRVRAGVVHVEHLGALRLPVRHHGGGGRPREPARVVHADADHERAAPPPRGVAGAPALADGRVRAARRALCPLARVGARAAAAHRHPGRPGDLLLGAALCGAPAGVHPDRRRRGRVRDCGDGPRGREHGRDGRGHAALTDATSRRPPAFGPF